MSNTWAIQRVNRPGSINFDKDGGICKFPCCNFNPVHNFSGMDTDSYFYVSPYNMVIYGEEPGPGLLPCLCLPLLCPLLSLLRICGQGCPAAHLCCGICSPVNYYGYTFSVVDGAIQCRINNKHCFTEDPAIVLFDVQAIRQVECRKRELFVPGDENSSGYMTIITSFVFEILYRTESHQLMLYKTSQLPSTLTHTPFTQTVNQFIHTYRTKTNGLVTFEMLGAQCGPDTAPLEPYKGPSRPYARPQPQNVMIREDWAAHAEPSAPPVIPTQESSLVAFDILAKGVECADVPTGQHMFVSSAYAPPIQQNGMVRGYTAIHPESFPATQHAFTEPEFDMY